MDSRETVILLVEDNQADAMLAKECFRKTSLSPVVHHVTDGDECMAFLRKTDQYAAAPTPDLILLDINMPRMNGHQVMEEILADPQLCRLPVVVLSTSNDEADVEQMMCRRCNSYIVKPMDLFTFQEIINGLCHYWFSLPGMVTGK